MQIKVKDTKMHKYPIKSDIEFEGQKETKAFKEVPVAEAELVLVSCMRNESLLGYSKYSGYALTDKWLSLPETWFKPILISKTEKIEVSDWVYQHNTKKVHQVTEIKNGLLYFHKDNLFTPIGNCDRILALPEHFSPKHLQAIVDGKIKEGDKVLVECELYITDQKDEAADFDLNLNAYKVKLNSSNHVTLHKKEEKMYTREEVRKILRFYVGSILPHTEEWFEQNVK